MKKHWINISAVFALMLSISSDMMAQSENYHFRETATKLYFIVVGVVVLAALLALYKMMMFYFDSRATDMLKASGQYVETSKVKRKTLWDKLYERATQYVPAEREKDILLDHNYDGIEELDNNLPPWWLWLFYLTIAFSVFYVYFYHMSPWKQSNLEEYEYNMAKAEVEVKEYKALVGETIDENNLEAMTDAKDLELGKATFINLCASCHVADGGGSVGPNLTDQYWLHGGSISDVFKTIKYGVPEKGMISWQSQLRPGQIHQVASYILTLQGTSPASPKAPQGELYKPATE